MCQFSDFKGISLYYNDIMRILLDREAQFFMVKLLSLSIGDLGVRMEVGFSFLLFLSCSPIVII